MNVAADTSGSAARRFKIVLAYDGTAYSGYQLQENGIAVQQRLEEVLEYINRSPVRVFGCSRTDAGVHARGFVAHFDLVQPIPPKNLVRAMNARLPPDIRVMRAAHARPDFDARRDALGKEYRYFVYNADIQPPHLFPYWAFQHRPLSLAAMQDAAARFVGRHDFVSFSANPRREIGSTVRNIFEFTVKKSGPRVVFAVKGDGFLYKQVRSMAGFLLRVGIGDEKPSAVTEILERAAPRTARVPTAPSRGLFLWRVFYKALCLLAVTIVSAIAPSAAGGSFDFEAISARRFDTPPAISNAVDALGFRRRIELPHSTGGVWRLSFDYTLDHSEGDRIFGARARIAFGPRTMPWGDDVRGIWIPDSGVEKSVLYPWLHEVDVMPGMTFVDVSFERFGKGDFRVANVRFEEIPPDKCPVTLEFPFGGYLDGEFQIGAGQTGFPMVAWRIALGEDEEFPTNRVSCRVSATHGFSIVDVAKIPPARSRRGGALFAVAVRANGEVGTEGELTLTAEVDGRTASQPLNLRLLTVPPVKAGSAPARYANGAYLGCGMAFPGDGNRALAETLRDAGATWLIPGIAALTNNPSLLSTWRAAGIKRITPDGSALIANGFSVGKNVVCPCALYGEASPMRIELRKKLGNALRGCDGMWSNWEPYAYTGRRKLCKRCKAAEKGLARAEVARLRSKEHGRVVSAIAVDVAAATDSTVGFVPGIYWPEIGPGHEGFDFTREIRAEDYLESLSCLNAFGPYVRWNTSVRYVPELGRALAYFCVAREVMHQMDEDHAPEARPQLMAFPLGLSGLTWASRPEWLELALESFFFNGWGAAVPWSFPAGGDARFLAAFARASECAAKWERFVWNGAREDNAVSVKPRGTVRRRSWIDRTYLPALRDVPLVQYASWEKGGDRIVAVFNFDESAAVVCDISLRTRTQVLEVPPSSCRVALFSRKPSP